MFKLAMALLGSAAVLAMPTTASAQRIASPAGPAITLTGDAFLNSNQCTLTLNATLGATNPYTGGSALNGTNVPNPAPICNVISITNGAFTLSNYSAGSANVNVSSLTINVAGTPCTTGPFTARASNISPTRIELVLTPTLTSCGLIEAYLETAPTGNYQVVL